MKSKLLPILTVLLATLDLFAQQAAVPFDSGSNGSLGDLVVSNAVLIPLPPDGVLHYKRVDIAAGGSVLFGKNALNTPVTLLAQGDVIIAGDIILDGTPPSGPDPGRGGPGGFDGGRGNSGAQAAGPGKGPGGGLPACCFVAGPGAFADRGDAGGERQPTAGEAYGDPLLLPLVGGSGGGGLQNAFIGGGGGGGAILVASGTRISLPGAEHGIYARGGDAPEVNDGSGGAIRLVAPRIEGVGRLHAQQASGGSGRVRLDTPDAANAKLGIVGSWSVGTLMITRLPVEPRLNILKVGDKDIPQDALGTVSVIFPNGTPAERNIVVQARDFGSIVPIRVALIPDFGERVLVDTTIDNSAPGAATKSIPVTFPLNVVVSVNAWTR